MVLKVAKREALVGDPAFRMMCTLPVFLAQKWVSDWNDAVYAVQAARSSNKVNYHGILIGVGNRPGQSAFEVYNNVSHWVYAPVLTNYKRPVKGDLPHLDAGKGVGLLGRVRAEQGLLPGLRDLSEKVIDNDHQAQNVIQSRRVGPTAAKKLDRAMRWTKDKTRNAETPRIPHVVRL